MTLCVVCSRKLIHVGSEPVVAAGVLWVCVAAQRGCVGSLGAVDPVRAKPDPRWPRRDPRDCRRASLPAAARQWRERARRGHSPRRKPKPEIRLASAGRFRMDRPAGAQRPDVGVTILDRLRRQAQAIAAGDQCHDLIASIDEPLHLGLNIMPTSDPGAEVVTNRFMTHVRRRSRLCGMRLPAEVLREQLCREPVIGERAIDLANERDIVL